MKRIMILVAIGLSLCSTASAAQGGGGESTKKKPVPKKSSVPKPVNTTPVRSTAPPIRPAAPALGGVIVRSNQPTANVTFNGTSVGTTDGGGNFAIGSLKPGVYTVSVTKPGYKPDITSVKVSAGQIETLNLDLRPRNQALNILSSQPKSEIYVDDILRGSTDAAGGLRLTDLPLGSHKITARKKGYKDASVSVSLVQEQEGRVNVSLEWAGGAPSFERPTYRVTVQLLERNSSNYTATLVFENLTNKTIKIAWQEQSNLVPDATGPYLIDEDGEKYSAKGTDSGKILQDTMRFLWFPVTELPPKTKLTSRFFFVGNGMGTTFSLKAKELIGLEPEVPITIDGITIGNQMEGTPNAISYTSTTADFAGSLDEMAWDFDNSGSTTHPVGEKKPNPWGLYDMYGNVSEWCQDWWDRFYKRNGPSSDPKGPSSGYTRVLRGGSWRVPATSLRFANLVTAPGTRYNYVGFRLVAVVAIR